MLPRVATAGAWQAGSVRPWTVCRLLPVSRRYDALDLLLPCLADKVVVPRACCAATPAGASHGWDEEGLFLQQRRQLRKKSAN